MAERRERVVLSLTDQGFSTGMVRAAGAAALLDGRLDALDGSSVRARDSIRDTGTEVNYFRRSTEQASPAIDRFSGRLRIMADTAAILGPSLVPISAVAIPAITGLSQQVGFAALGMGTLVVAAQGVGDALKAVNEAALEPTAANLEKASEAMSRLGPDAQAFVSRFQELRPVLTEIRDSAAAGWFPGLTDSLDSLERVAPWIGDLFERIGTVGGDLVAMGAEAFAGPQWDDFRAFVIREAPAALHDLGLTVGNTVTALADLWMAFSPVNADFSDWLLDASRSFREWSEGLSETQGFQEFIAYIRENGPRVADALGALGGALVQIVEAIAPLGGPSLKIVETFADAIGSIADSDLGTPILAGVAALALLNRTLAVTSSLSTRLGFTGAAGSSAAGVGLFGAMGGRTAGIRALGGDLRTYGALRTQVLARETWETERMNAAAASARANLAGMAKAATPAAVAIGALAAASTDAGEGLGATNAAMGGMLGLMAGPWGAAAGAAAGSILDIKEAVQQLDEVLASGSQRAASNTLQSRLDGLSNPLNQPSIIGSEVWSKITTGQFASQRLATQAGGFSSAGSLGSMGIDSMADASRYRREMAKSADEAAAAEAGLSTEAYKTAKAFGLNSAQIQSNITALDAQTAAALGAFSAETRLREAMVAARKQADSNNDGIRGNSSAAIANRQALEGLASAWATQQQAMEDQGASADKVEAKWRKTRREFINVARDMGVPIGKARELARQLLAVPDEVKVRTSISGTEAVEAAIGRLTRPRLVTITAVTNANVADAKINGQADGGTVYGQRQPYGDKVPTMLAPGEEVISNRNGQADRWRPLLKAINANRLANGGTVQGLAGGGTVNSLGALGWAGLPAINLTTASFAKLNDALKDSQRALARETSQREKAAGLRGTVAGNLRSDLFGETSAWSSASAGGSVAGALGILRGDIRTGRDFRADVATLRGAGLRGDALSELLQQSPEVVDMFANSSRADLREYQRLYNVRQSVTASAGSAAGSAAYPRATVQQTRVLAQRLDRIEAAIRQEHRHDRDSSRRGASGAARNRKKG